MSGGARFSLRLRLHQGQEIAMGPGKAALLRAIADQGSISAAARALEMSYRRAWLLVDTMNRAWRMPLVETATGGSHGGGARLSPLGVQVLAAFEQTEAALAAAAADGPLAALAERELRPPC